MESEGVMISEVNQAQGDKCHMLSDMEAKELELTEVESRMESTRGWEGEGPWGWGGW